MLTLTAKIDCAKAAAATEESQPGSEDEGDVFYECATSAKQLNRVGQEESTPAEDFALTGKVNLAKARDIIELARNFT